MKTNLGSKFILIFVEFVIVTNMGNCRKFCVDDFQDAPVCLIYVQKIKNIKYTLRIYVCVSFVSFQVWFRYKMIYDGVCLICASMTGNGSEGVKWNFR